MFWARVNGEDPNDDCHTSFGTDGLLFIGSFQATNRINVPSSLAQFRSTQESQQPKSSGEL
uniref:Uncharacterized protein n=1 Tax=Heterorhabditis bacteriophora TaxID=37862 RepID=A0A1I7XCL6_HETBA